MMIKSLAFFRLPFLLQIVIINVIAISKNSHSNNNYYIDHEKETIKLNSKGENSELLHILWKHSDSSNRHSENENNNNYRNKLVFLAHGCHHRAEDFFSLPIETIIVEKFLQGGFTVMAISSLDEHSKCWSPFSDNKRVETAIKYIISNKLHGSSNTNRKTRISLYLFGVSSGGAFVSALALHQMSLPIDDALEISSICIQISAMPNIPSQAISGINGLYFPHVIFIHSRRDKDGREVIDKQIVQLRQIFMKENIAIEQYITRPHTLNEKYFYRMRAVDTIEESEMLFQSFVNNGIINGNSGNLTTDPRYSTNKWNPVAIKALPRRYPGIDSLKPDKSALSEVLNDAYNQHEITSEFIDETIHFFTNHSSKENHSHIKRSHIKTLHQN